MEMIACIDPASLQLASDVDRILLDSRLLYQYMRERKSGREYVDFTYKKFHVDLVTFEHSLGEAATYTAHKDHEFDKRSIPDYLLVGVVDAGAYLSKYYTEYTTSIVSLTKRLSAELRDARTVINHQAAQIARHEGRQAVAQKVTDDYIAKFVEYTIDARVAIADMPETKKQRVAYDSATKAEQMARDLRSELTRSTGVTAAPLPSPAQKAEDEQARKEAKARRAVDKKFREETGLPPEGKIDVGEAMKAAAQARMTARGATHG